MSSGHNFLDPNAYSHLVPTQQAPTSSSVLSQPSVSAAGRTRKPSQRSQYNAANGATEAEQHEIWPFEDPAAPNPGDRGDSEYDGMGRKKRKKGTQGSKIKATRGAQPIAQHTPIGSQPPPTVAPSLPNLALLVPPTAVAPPFYPAPQPLQSHFTLTSTIPSHASQAVAPTYPQTYPATYIMQSQIASSTPMVPSSPAVPMGIWSDSSSSHGQPLRVTFNHSSPLPHRFDFSHGVAGPIQSPTLAGDHRNFPLIESDEEEDDNDDFTPFCPTVQPAPPTLCPSAAPGTITGLPNQPSLSEVTNTINNQGESAVPHPIEDNDDVPESLRNKTKRRRQPHSRLASSLGSAASDQAPVEKIDADPTNLNAYNNQERLFLHLV